MTPSVTPREVVRRAFPGIQDAEADEMLLSGKVHTYPPSTVLCREGDFGNTFYIILEGGVVATKLINETEVRVLKRLDPGDFFGEMALIHNAPRAATITATEPTTVIEISKDAFSSLLERSTSMSLAIIREVSRRLRENDELAIEDLREKARELADAYQQLAEQDYARREFLTTIAHELRTPLTAAGGFLQVIRLGMVQGDALTGALDTIARNIQEIIALTNDILFLQEMDLILPEFEPTDVGAVVAAAVERQRQRAERTGVGLSLTIAPGLPAILADARSLERALTAILDNAIKFSPDGGLVSIELGVNTSELWVSVADHGVGIPPESLPRIFDRFFHLDEVGDHMFRGVGLGLSIARQVIEQHHGRIEVATELGVGSCFTVRLPLPMAG